jgi:hypothetical protein
VEEGRHVKLRHLLPALACTSLLVGACGASAPQATTSPTGVVTSSATVAASSTPAATETPSEVAGPKTFTSARHGYTVTLPGDWPVSEAPGTWNNTVIVPELVPPAGAGGFDRMSDPGIGIIIAGSEPLSADTTLDSWLADSITKSKALFGACTYGTTKPVKFGTEAGRTVAVDCGTNEASPNLEIAVATHKGVGYEFVWRGRAGSVAEDLATFNAILGTVRFAS